MNYKKLTNGFVRSRVKDSRRVKDNNAGIKLNGYKAFVRDMETYTNKISDDELKSWFNFPESKEFWLKDFLNGVAEVAEKIGDLIAIKYSKTTGWYFIELDGNSMDATISFQVEKIETSPNFVYDIKDYFGDDKAIVDRGLDWK